MATSGSFTGTAKNSSGTVSSNYTFTIAWQRNSYSIENNTSNITVSLKIQCPNYSNSAYNLSKYPSVSLAVNGTSKTPTVSYIDTRNYQLCTFATWTGDVTHNEDGSLSCPIAASFTHYGSTSLGSGLASGNAELDTIPRAATFDYLSCDTPYFTGAFTYKYTPKTNAYFYTFCIYLNDNNKFTLVRESKFSVDKIQQYSPQPITLSQDELKKIYGLLPNATNGTLRFFIRTYSDLSRQNQIGRDQYKDITLSIPDSVKPSIGSISLSIQTWSQLIQAKNQITVTTSGCQPGDGSSIKSYVFDVLSGNAVIATTTTTSTSATFGPFMQTGTLKFRVTVTDQRSRSVSNSGSEPTETCYAYTAPSFSSFTVYRCDSNEEADDNGTNIKYSLNINYADVNNTNTAIVKIYYKKSTDSSWTTAQNALSSNTATNASAIIKNTSGSNVTFNANDTYLVRAEIADTYSSSGIYSSTITVFGASRIFNIRQNGSGIAFGKMAESDNLLECKWPAKFNDNCDVLGTLKIGTSSQYETPKDGIHVHDVRYVDITPDSFGDNNVNFYFDQIESMNNRWMGIMHMKGWSGSTNAAWELAGNGHSNLNDDTLRYRQGMGAEWGDWQTVLTNKNIAANSVATLYENSSGTTGTITLSKTAANFAYLEFFLFKDITSGWWSVKVPSPNGKNVQIGTQYFANSGTTNSGVGLQFIGKTLTISDTTITQNQEYYMNFDKSVDGNVVGAGTQTTVKVMKVLGYKY